MTAWHKFIGHPLFSVGLTLLAFQLAVALYRRSGWLLLQPVLVGMLLIVAVLALCGIDYRDYRRDAEPIAWLLGPATVALAVPLRENLARIRQLFWPIVITLAVAGVLTVLITLLVCWLLGASDALSMSLAPKSVTMPIAMLVADQLGGVAALTAVMVMLTGVIGTVLGPPLLRLARVDHPAARGFSYGINAHAIGTAHALQESRECGAFAALAMSLLGVATALLMPWLLS